MIILLSFAIGFFVALQLTGRAMSNLDLIPTPEYLYKIVYSQDSAHIKGYPTQGLYIKCAGEYLAVTEIGKSVYATLREAASSMHPRKK